MLFEKCCHFYSCKRAGKLLSSRTSHSNRLREALLIYHDGRHKKCKFTDLWLERIPRNSNSWVRFSFKVLKLWSSETEPHRSDMELAKYFEPLSKRFSIRTICSILWRISTGDELQTHALGRSAIRRFDSNRFRRTRWTRTCSPLSPKLC